jgi:hypothetical protein
MDKELLETLEVLVKERERDLTWWKQYKERDDRPSDHVFYGGEWRSPPLRASVDTVVMAKCLLQDALNDLIASLSS